MAEYARVVLVSSGVAGRGDVIGPALLVHHRRVRLVVLTFPSFQGQFTVRVDEGENTGSSWLEAGESVAGETVGSLLGVHVEEGHQLGPSEGQTLEIFLRLLDVQFSTL